VDHEFDVVDVDTARRDIRCDEHGGFASVEVRETLLHGVFEATGALGDNSQVVSHLFGV